MNNSVDNIELLVGDCIECKNQKHKIKKSEYLSTGTIPVIDQSQAFIAGYINETERAYDGDLPVLIPFIKLILPFNIFLFLLHFS